MFSSDQLSRLKDLFIKYVEVKSELVKTHIKNEIARVIANLIVLFLFIGSGFLIVLLGSFALSFYLNDIFDSSYLGFVMVMGLYIFLTAVVYFSRKNLMKTMVYKKVSKYFESESAT